MTPTCERARLALVCAACLICAGKAVAGPAARPLAVRASLTAAEEQLQDTVRIRGRVQRVMGNSVAPAAGVTVILSTSGEARRDTVQTDSRGHFVFDRAPMSGQRIAVLRADGVELRCLPGITLLSSADAEIYRLVQAGRQPELCTAFGEDLLRVEGVSDTLRIALRDTLRRGTVTITVVDTVRALPVRSLNRETTEQPSQGAAPSDTAIVYVVVTEPSAQGTPGWWLGVGGGLASSFVGGMSFVVPAVAITALKDDGLYVTLTGGWRPMGPKAEDPLFPGDPRPQFDDRAEAIASLNVSLYPNDRWGYSFGVVGMWETVRESDFYLERAYGLTGGLRLRTINPASFVVGLDLQLSNLSEFGRSGSRWELGVGTFLTVSHVFR